MALTVKRKTNKNDEYKYLFSLVRKYGKYLCKLTIIRLFLNNYSVDTILSI